MDSGEVFMGASFTYHQVPQDTLNMDSGEVFMGASFTYHQVPQDALNMDSGEVFMGASFTYHQVPQYGKTGPHVNIAPPFHRCHKKITI